ncbi:dihydrolipoyl dehydrogenase [Clostridium magnum]|uniref:Dihydrolipoyl dehydrogenase n=1 Tax=Clostridium magnum DSM 2767 TaxID=1121326 RepID=A0A161X5E4_9CLOT|nr:dihydrolipoyl dehydrogenase [Clostridium magnum]KZL89206.1 dihydrolipoyl dehydrogenase [Clostridium magnum DSM 2767]SHJ35597.1 dihydrolipoamide dehydrogenase [Clostridium magnum DSM 2767]
MATKVIMPKQGLQMTEGTITRWIIAEGGKVEVDQPLFEMETDKLTIEITAPASGILLKIVREEGDVVPITETIAVIGEPGEDYSSLLDTATLAAVTQASEPTKVEDVKVETKKSANQYDIIIIGGGPGGYPAAIYAAKKNAKVAIVEKDEFGGTCLNRGCIPTKTLIKTASLYNEIKACEQFGIEVEGVNIKWDKALANKDKVLKTLRMGISGLLKKNKVDVYKGNGLLVDENTVKIEGSKEETITGDKIIIASGSLPVTIPVPGAELEEVITSNEALEFKEIPKSMAIIGGGVIGIELGYVYRSLGTDVTVIEMLPEILPRQDLDAIKVLRKSLEKSGIKILTDTKLAGIEKDSNGLKVNYETKIGKDCVVVEKVLMSVGRKPELGVINGLPIETDRKGIVVDDYLKTSIPNIYAIGDVTGKVMLAHVATHQAITAVRNALGHEEKMNYKVIPACIYTHPEIASVGLTEEEAKEQYGNIKVGKFSFSACGKAMTIGETEGFVKIVSDTKWNEILGVHIVGPHATELIAEGALAIKLQCTVEELTETIHAHPTLSECVMEASLDVIGEAIHK